MIMYWYKIEDEEKQGCISAYKIKQMGKMNEATEFGECLIADFIGHEHNIEWQDPEWMIMR